MHLALKIGLYAVGSLAFLAISSHIKAPKNENQATTSDSVKDPLKTPVNGPEKAVLNTKVSQMDLDAPQMKAVLNRVTKDMPVGTVLVGTANVQKML